VDFTKGVRSFEFPAGSVPIVTTADWIGSATTTSTRHHPLALRFRVRDDPDGLEHYLERLDCPRIHDRSMTVPLKAWSLKL